jgi:hypothetical protein
LASQIKLLPANPEELMALGLSWPPHRFMWQCTIKYIIHVLIVSGVHHET